MPRKKASLTSEIAQNEQPLKLYGMNEVRGWGQADYDQVAFAKRFPLSRGCPTRWELFKSMADTFLPGHFEWHDWTERAIKPLVPDIDSEKLVLLRGFSGCSNSAKTRNITSFAVLWWLAWPEESSVTLVSTTKQMVRRRAWAETQAAYSCASKAQGGIPFGNMVDSRMVWQSQKGDDKHAIITQAVEDGTITKIVDNIKGTHTRRQMIIVDEATSIPRAIYEACSNLYTYPDEFILCAIGNPWSRLDQFGIFCEPNDGWNSVNVDTGEWEARPFEACGGIKPWITTFDAEKSPNIVEGKVVSRHLPKKEEVLAAKANSGGGNTPLYWSNKRGFWPPEGLTKTVFTESAIKKFNAVRGVLTFTNYTVIGVLDPAFGGGDNPCLRFARLGRTEEGGWGIQSMPPIMLAISAKDAKNPAGYQLLEQVRAHCLKVEVEPGVFRECRPENFGVDDSGGEGGLCDIFAREWSPNIHRIQFQGSASTDSVSLEDPRPANDVYFNKRAEMYHYASTAMQYGQLKGIDEDTARELCSIEVNTGKRRISMQDKHEYRASHGNQSPDRSDSFVMLAEVARRRGFSLKPIGQTLKLVEAIDETNAKNEEVYREENMYQEETLEEMQMEPVESLYGDE